MWHFPKPITSFHVSWTVTTPDQPQGRLPVKWMAFESLTHRAYSTQTDV